MGLNTERTLVPPAVTYRDRCEYTPRVMRGGGPLPIEEQCELAEVEANRLLDRLYTPEHSDDYAGWRRGREPEPQIGGEPINWGDLHAYVEAMADGTFVITLEEAAADSCPQLCAYVERWMTAWGWPCRVVTEW